MMLSTEYSAFDVESSCRTHRRIKFPLNEPARLAASRRSKNTWSSTAPRRAAYRHEYRNIIETVRAMRHNDVSFLRVPHSYYEMLPERVGPDQGDSIDELAELASS